MRGGGGGGGGWGLVVLSFNIDIFSANIHTEWDSKISLAHGQMQFLGYVITLIGV